jgi:hypothetical protein
MAGSATTFTENTHTAVKKINCAWTSDDTTGAVSGTTTYPYTGKLIGLTTIPSGGGTAPTADYDLAVNDADGHDVLLGAGANRHTSNTEYVASASLGAAAGSALTVAITAAGNSKQGTVVLYIY